MGSVSLKIGDGTARFKRSTLCSSGLQLLMLLSLLLTNLFALYSFSSPPLQPPSSSSSSSDDTTNNNLISQHVSLILREIVSSQRKLSLMERDLAGFDILDPSSPSLPPDLKLFLRPHPLPLGKDSRSGLTEMVSSIGHSCAASADLLSQFMTYSPAGACPDDTPLAQRLVLRGCEPLPRRRCFARAAPKPGLLRFPLSLWSPVSDKIMSWAGFGCKNFACYNAKNGGSDFDLAGNGLERQSWVRPRGKSDFLADDVLAMGGGPGGGVWLGFDIGGKSGHFAAVMAEKNVTVITSTLNLNAPYNEFIAARGLFPLDVSLNQRFPFYDGVFDLVHTGSGALGDVSNVEKLEFFMFDIDRILRANGLFWLDNFYCVDEESKRVVTRLIERFGYKKLRWVVGEKKVDRSETGRPQVYLSAVLQKPVRG